MRNAVDEPVDVGADADPGGGEGGGHVGIMPERPHNGRRDRSPSLAWVLAGVLAGLAGLATSYATAMVLTIRDSPVVAVAEMVIRLTPGPVVERAISVLGHFDKPVLVGVVLLLLVLLLRAGGLLARGGWWPLLVWFGLLAGVGLAAVLSQRGAASGRRPAGRRRPGHLGDAALRARPTPSSAGGGGPTWSRASDAASSSVAGVVAVPRSGSPSPGGWWRQAAGTSR